MIKKIVLITITSITLLSILSAETIGVSHVTGYAGKLNSDTLDSDVYGFEANWAIWDDFMDLNFAMSQAEGSLYSYDRKVNGIDLNAIFYTYTNDFFKPFASLTVGYANVEEYTSGYGGYPGYSSGSGPSAPMGYYSYETKDSSLSFGVSVGTELMVTEKLSIIPSIGYQYFEYASEGQTSVSALIDYEVSNGMHIGISGYAISSDNQSPKGFNVFVRYEL